MWRAYYEFVSDILQGKVQSASTVRSEVATELRRVETSYENELLRRTQFPKASESNIMIEEWVEEFAERLENRPATNAARRIPGEILC